MENEAPLQEFLKPKFDDKNQDFLSHNNQLEIPPSRSDDSSTEFEVELQDKENNEEFSNELFLEKLDLNLTPASKEDKKIDKEIHRLEVVITETNSRRKAKMRKKFYTCQLCHVLVIFPNVNTHFKLIHNIETFSCNICIEIFWLEETYKKHKCGIQTNNFLKQKVVPSSNKDSVENIGPTQKQQEKIHFEKSLETPEEANGSKRYSCMLCTSKFFLTKNLKNHFRGNHKIEIYDCNICGKVFLAQNLLENHSKIHKKSSIMATTKPILMINEILPAKKYPHNPVLTKIRNVKTIKCKICKEKFHTKEELQNHKNVTHNSESIMIHSESSRSTEINEKNYVLEKINLKSSPGAGIKTSDRDISITNDILTTVIPNNGMEDLKIMDIDIAPDQTIHIIFYKSKKYITSAEVSALIPKFKGRDVLQKMLKLHKMEEISPFVAKKETYRELFEECIIEGVAGVENDDGEIGLDVLLYELNDIPKIFDRFISDEVNPELIQTYLKIKNFM